MARTALRVGVFEWRFLASDLGPFERSCFSRLLFPMPILSRGKFGCSHNESDYSTKMSENHLV